LAQRNPPSLCDAAAEYVELDSIVPRLYLLARMIVEAGKE